MIAEDARAPAGDARRGRVCRIALAGLAALRQGLERIGRFATHAARLPALARSRS